MRERVHVNRTMKDLVADLRFYSYKKTRDMFAKISLVLYLNVSVLTFGGYNISLPPSNSYQLR